MIILDSDYASMYKQLLEEKDRVHYWVEKGAKKVWKQFKQSKTLPVFANSIITMSKTNNQYLLWYYAMTRAEFEHETCFAGQTLITNDSNGNKVAVVMKTLTDTNDRNKCVDSIQIFSGHFFSRYRQRYPYMKDLSTIDLMTSFFGRNGGYLMEVEYEKFTLEKDRVPFGSAWGLDDGVSLAMKRWIEISPSKKILVVRHNTFLTRNELKEDQLAVLPSQDDMRSRLVHHYK